MSETLKEIPSSSSTTKKKFFVRPIRTNLLLEKLEVEAQTKGGIYIPPSADANAKGTTRGRIVAMAEDCDTRRYKFKIGMIVVFSKFAYTEINIPPAEAGEMGKTLYLLAQDKVEACIDEK